MKKAVSFLYFFVFSCLLFSVTALAYIDPSAMTYMIQLAAGIAIAAGAGAGYYFRRIRQRFSRRGGGRAAAAPSWDEEDDDDTGYGDYEMDGPEAPRQVFSAPAPETDAAPDARPVHFEEVPAWAGGAPSPAPDPYDETGGMAGLIAENRELRRLLAQERRNVEELKRALHICTAPRK